MIGIKRRDLLFCVNPKRLNMMKVINVFKKYNSGMGSGGVTVTKFLQLLMVLELYLEQSYFLSQNFIVVTLTEVTKVPKFLV